MELLDKLKLNSPVVKIGDDYKATFPSKSGTIAFTDDIETLKTKSIQSSAQSSGIWTVSLDSNYTSAPFVQVFDGENKIVFPSIKFVAPNSLEIEFDGKDSIAQGEFTAVISTPFTSTVELDETVVTINSDQGISGVKNFTGTLQYQGSEVAKKSEIPSLNGYATEDFVANCINAVEIPDVSSFITKDVENLTNYTKTTELVSDYAKKTDWALKLKNNNDKGSLVIEDGAIKIGNGQIEINNCGRSYFDILHVNSLTTCSLPTVHRDSITPTQDDQLTSKKYVDEYVDASIESLSGFLPYDKEHNAVSQSGDFTIHTCGGNLIFDVTSCTDQADILFRKLPVSYSDYTESYAAIPTKNAHLTTKEYVDNKVDSATQHLKTKSYQSVETTGDKWTITLDSEYSSAPFFQVFNSENSVVYPEVKFTAPSTLELTFEGKEGIGLGEFTVVVSVPFTTTITPNEYYVSIGTAQGISGKKNFTTVPTINSVDIATVDNLSTTENSVKSYVDTEISAKIASVYRFKGDSTYASLPANAQVGDVYNLTTASGEYKIGDNVAWTGSKWDKLAATVDLSGYLTTSSASSTYLTISSASSTYATKDKTIDISDTGTKYMSGTLCLSNTSACVSAPFLVARKSIYVGAPDLENDTSYFNGPVEFTDTVSVSELEIDNLTLETLEIGNEINVNGIAVSESISKLNAKTGSLEHVLPAKDPIGGVVEWEVTINTDLTKTVKCPPNVIVCDITGERYKYVVCDVEWDGANKIYIKFDNDDPIEDNQFKAYITNIQLQ